MGLMLGASVMTVCEIIDLLLYNGLMKCMKRNRVGTDSAQSERETRDQSDCVEEDLDENRPPVGPGTEV